MESCVKAELSSLNNTRYGSVDPVLEKYETALLLLVGFGGVSILLALIHRFLRKYVYDDVNNIDTAFDAGGRVSTSLTAVTVASQLLWPVDLLQSSTVAVKSGVSGPWWYISGVAMIAIFPAVTVCLKSRAPGVKTYLQIMRARYGTSAHVIFTIMALVVNLLTMSTVIMAGIAVIQSYTKEASDEFCVFTLAILCGSYTLIGGLGTTFYVSYFNTVLIYGISLAFILTIFYSTDSEEKSIQSVEEIYNNVQCLLAPDGNENRSFMTFESKTGFLWAFLVLIMTFCITCCDQATWQSRIAAKPVQGVLGFLFGGYLWLAIPLSLATSSSLAYLSMASQNSSTILTDADINAGLVFPFMAQHLLGKIGGILVLTAMAMAVMSTGSGEIMAVSSIIIYDIYQIYVNPYRKGFVSDSCILCNLPDEKTVSENVCICTCPSVVTCKECYKDLNQKQEDTTKYHHSRYTCKYHGNYRHYQDTMLAYKNWCILWTTIAIIPLGLILIATKIDINFALLFGFTIILPVFPPVAMSVFWSKATKAGVISGAVAGTLCGMGVTFGVASTYEGGLGNFLVNAVEFYTVISGTTSSICASFLATILVSCGTTTVRTDDDINREWAKLYRIDNPLHPWSLLYVEDIPNLPEGERPTPKVLDKVFRKARLLAYIGGAVTLILTVVIIPSTMLSLNELSLSQFTTWIRVTHIYTFVMAAVVFVVAPVEEVIQVLRQLRQKRRDRRVAAATAQAS